jgi:hypothetical protein
MLKKLAEMEYQTQLRTEELRQTEATNEFVELVKRAFNKRFNTKEFTGFYFNVYVIDLFQVHIETVDDLKIWAGLKDMPKPYVEEDVIFSLIVDCPSCNQTISSKPISSRADIGKYLKAIETQSHRPGKLRYCDLAAECYPHHRCFEH